jgi:hypothetical protein
MAGKPEIPGQALERTGKALWLIAVSFFLMWAHEGAVDVLAGVRQAQALGLSHRLLPVYLGVAYTMITLFWVIRIAFAAAAFTAVALPLREPASLAALMRGVRNTWFAYTLYFVSYRAGGMALVPLLPDGLSGLAAYAAWDLLTLGLFTVALVRIMSPGAATLRVRVLSAAVAGAVITAAVRTALEALAGLHGGTGFWMIVRFAAFTGGFYLCALFCSALAPAQRPVQRQLVLVNPLWTRFWGAISQKVGGSYPPFFIVLKSHTPSDWKIREYNGYWWRNGFVNGPCLVAISCFSSNAYRAYAIAKRCRRAGATVVMGGPHVSYCPDEALAFCDAIVIGEAEGVWAQLTADYEAGRLQRRYMGNPVDDFHEKTHDELMRMPPALSCHYVESTRGCKFNCDFCAIPILGFRRIRHKPLERFIEHVAYFKQARRRFSFMDNNIYADREYLLEMCEKLEPLGVRFGAGVSIDIARDPEAFDAAYRAGLRRVLIGYEIAEQSDARGRVGKFSLVDRYLELSRKFHERGIRIRGAFMVGFDGDTPGYYLRMFRMIARIRPQVAGVAYVTPLPGTRLFERYLGLRRIATLNWKQFDLRQVTIIPAEMPVAGARVMYTMLRLGAFFLLSATGQACTATIVLYVIVVTFMKAW